MLQAKLNNGKLITLFQYSKMEIEKLRTTQQFFCPVCKEKVIIRAGSKTIAHFAHQSSSNCHTSEGGESAYHEKGKLLLYKWLLGQGLNVSLEEYIPAIRQRADIYLRIGDKKIAIEYQCARISAVDMQNRTKGYFSEGIQPIWILGGNLFHRAGKYQLKIDHFILQFLHQYSNKHLPVLYFFDPHSSTFITASNLLQLQKHRMITRLSMKKLQQIHLTELFKIPPVEKEIIISEWKKAKYKFRVFQPKKLYGKEQLWYKWLYYKKAHREHLPSMVYLPVPSQFRMTTPPWDWQSRICLEVIEPLPLKQKFTLDTCQYQLRKATSNETPLLIKSPTDPILEYLHILCSLGIIKQISETTFTKEKELIHYTHIEDALIGDNYVMDELSAFFQVKIRA